MWRTFLSIVGGVALVILGYICFVYVTTNVAARGWYGVTSNNIASDGLKPVVEELHKISAQGNRIETKVDKVHQRLNKVDYKVTKNGEGINRANAGIDKIQECLGPICGNKIVKPTPNTKTVAKVVVPAPPVPVVAPVINRSPDVVPTATGDYLMIEARGRPSIILARKMLMEPEPCCPSPAVPAVVEQPQRQPVPPPPTNCEDRRWRGRCFGR